jgi:hypothetical protein
MILIVATENIKQLLSETAAFSRSYPPASVFMLIINIAASSKVAGQPDIPMAGRRAHEGNFEEAG